MFCSCVKLMMSQAEIFTQKLSNVPWNAVQCWFLFLLSLGRSLRFPVSAIGSAGIPVEVSFLLSTIFFFLFQTDCSHQGMHLFLLV